MTRVSFLYSGNEGKTEVQTLAIKGFAWHLYHRTSERCCQMVARLPLTPVTFLTLHTVVHSPITHSHFLQVH